MRSPVLLLVFNRPEITRRVLQAIRSARPNRLYIAADGPRENQARDIDLCKEVRCIVDAIDWPCQVQTYMRERNEGCRIAVSNAINWFFRHESEGIILEDDVLPEPTFFRFCDEMLDRYRTDSRISMIGGCNLISSIFTPESDESYFFLRMAPIWGWATWKRAWEHYDVEMADWPAWRDQGGLKELSEGDRSFELFWQSTLDLTHDGKIDTWDFQWTFTCWRSRRLTVLPGVNLISNLGFGKDATHTKFNAPSHWIASTPKPIFFPLKHPIAIQRNSRADALIDLVVFGIDSINRQLLASGSPFVPRGH